MCTLSDDDAFIRRAQVQVRAVGLMTSPRFESRDSRLVEGDLQLDLLNLWHLTRQGASPATATLFERWARPVSLGDACAFGRVDVVLRLLEESSESSLDWSDDPIAQAVAAWVVTDLHVQCVRALLGAGAPVTMTQIHAHAAESVGHARDTEVLALLRQHGRHAVDPSVRAWATS